MPESDREYYRRRLAQERFAAAQAACGRTRGVHLELVERYSARLQSLEAAAQGACVVPLDDYRASGRA